MYLEFVGIVRSPSSLTGEGETLPNDPRPTLKWSGPLAEGCDTALVKRRRGGVGTSARSRLTERGRSSNPSPSQISPQGCSWPPSR